MLFNSEIIIIGLAALISFYIFIKNIVKRLSFTLNRIFSVLAFFSSVMFALLMLQHLNLGIMPLINIARINAALILFVSIIFYHLMFLYPENIFSKSFFVIFMISLPGYVVVFLTIFTDIIIEDVNYQFHFIYSGGRYISLFIGLISFYLLGAVVNTLLTVKSLKNRTLRREMLYILFTLGIHAILIIFSVFVLPVVNNIFYFRNIGLSISGVYILIILHYAVYDIKVLDLKKYFVRIFYWHIIILSLIFPASLALYLNLTYFHIEIPLLLLSLIFFAYIFLMYFLVKPAVTAFFEKEYKKLERDFNLLFGSSFSLNVEGKRDNFWELFYSRTIDDFAEKFKINGISLYLYKTKNRCYEHEYSVGKEEKIKEIDSSHPIVRTIALSDKIIDKSSLYYDSIYGNYKNESLNYFEKNDIEIAIPLYNIENKLMAFIFLGELFDNKLYSKTFISILELYKIQFEYLLRNGLVLDEVKKKQLLKHDKLLIDSIKKNIRPNVVAQIGNLRASSICIDKSKFGGDLISSLKIDKNRIAYFAGYVENIDIQSSFILLELYAAFNSQTKKSEGADNILNNINWVLSTSRYSDYYVSAFCLIYNDLGELNYSSASYNPLIIFDPLIKEFKDIELKAVPLSLDKKYIYESKTISFKAESIALVYSPGLISGVNELGESYSIERLKNIIYDNYEDTPAILTRKIYKDFIQFVDDKKIVNDVSLLILKG